MLIFMTLQVLLDCDRFFTERKRDGEGHLKITERRRDAIRDFAGWLERTK